MRIEFQVISVSREKQVRDNPYRALAAVSKRVITNNSVSLCRSIGVYTSMCLSEMKTSGLPAGLTGRVSDGAKITILPAVSGG